MANIYESISNVMKDIGAIGKNDVNEYDKYKFRGIDAVYNALNGALVKNKVFIVPELLDLEQEDRQTAKGGVQIHSKVKVKYTLFAEDGTSITSVFPGEAMDRSDKSINKAMTAAYKYMLFELFTIPTEENKDADAESPEAGQKKSDAPVMTEQNAEKKMSKAQIKQLMTMLDKKQIPYDFALEKMNWGVTDLNNLTVLQGNLMFKSLEKLEQLFLAEQTANVPFPEVEK